jgi:hypothetical protein
MLTAKFRYNFWRNSATFREIIITTFREINISFVFREITKSDFRIHPSQDVL